MYTDQGGKVNELHLFAGAGGGMLGGQLLGHTTICAVEIGKHQRQVLLQRQRDRILPKFPIWDDVCTFDGRPWRGSVDVLAGGFPCQDISAAGKGAGIAGKRSGLWKEYARIIDEIRPRFVFAENSPLLRTRGLGVVLKDLASLGYDARWCVLGARDVGAPHKRDRMWVLASNTRCKQEGAVQGIQPEIKESKRKDASNISSLRPTRSNLANTNDNGQASTEKRGGIAQGSDTSKARKKSTSKPAGLCASRADKSLAYTNSTQRQGAGFSIGSDQEHSLSMSSGSWWGQDPAETSQPKLGRVANGVANRVDRLKAIGNGQVPQCAAMAFRILSEGLTKETK